MIQTRNIVNPVMDHPVSPPMNELEFVRIELMAIGRAGWAEVSESTGVPFQTLSKVAYGHTENPRYLTVRGLFDYLKAKPNGRRKARPARR